MTLRVAVTGNVGKKTTRQMIDCVLRSASPTAEDDRAEGGAASVGVVTWSGDPHADAGLAAAAELLETLPETGWAIMAGDHPGLRRAADRCRAKIVWVGRRAGCDVLASDVRWSAGELSFRVQGVRFGVPVWGRHHLHAALAAVAVGKVLEMELEEVAGALAGFQPPPRCCQVKRSAAGAVIDDTCNRSAMAMRAALQLLQEFDSPGRRVVVCGDLEEPGQDPAQVHFRLGRDVVTSGGADELLACGHYAEELVAGAQAAGMSAERAVACRGESPWIFLEQRLASGDVLLLKGDLAEEWERVLHETKGTNV